MSGLKVVSVCGVLTLCIAATAVGCSSQGGTSPGQERLGVTSAALSVACTDATLSTTATSPVTAGTQVPWTAGSASCANPTYQFWQLAPGGRTPWTVVQDWSTSPTYAWDTTSAIDGTYQFEVWVKDASSSAPYDTYADSSLDVEGGGASCANGALLATPGSPEAAGTPVSLSGSSSACANPQYEFWILAPGGQTPWTIVQPWGASSTYGWDTTTSNFGSYELEVWIKDANSTTTSFDTYGDISFDVTASGTCSNGQATANPASPQNLGTQVTISGTNVDCGNALYQYWQLAPGGKTGWTVVQDWTSSASYAWDTSTATAGVYQWEVWMKDSSSTTSNYDTYAGFSYEVDGSFVPCTNAMATPTPGSPETAGTPVSVNASSSACVNPQYEFWMLAPGGATGWTVVQSYGVPNSYSWDTSGGSGDYQFEVWVRDANSTAAYDTYTGFDFTVQ